MSWFGDVGNFELFNLKGMGNQIKDNPARLLYGSADPFSTKVWNKVLGRDDKPLVDQFGGAAEHRYGEAEDAGINTGPGKTMHGVAKTIAGLFAGGYGANAMGGASAAGGTGASGVSGVGSAAPWADGAGTIVSPAAGSGSGAIGGLPQSGGLLSSANSAMREYKPLLDASSTGIQMSGLLDPQQPGPQAPEPMQVQGGSETLAQISSQGNPAMQQDMQERARRRAMLRGGV